MIVDDDGNNLHVLKNLLEDEGFQVRTAENGKEALDKASEEPPNLIISDISMPVMDGYSFCQQCKSDKHLKNIPFVFYSATYEGQKGKKYALSLGADRLILKPQKPETLIRILLDVLNNSIARQLGWGRD